MSPSGAPRGVLAAGLGIAAALLAAGARAEGFRSPAAGDSLTPGTSAAVEWIPTDRVDPSVSEMELVLSLDGGRTFPIRVTREIDPEAASFLWTVPALFSSHARLALRAGNGRARGEAIRFVSEEFEIVGDSGEPAEPLLRTGSEWRTRESLRPEERREPLSGGLASAPTLRAGATEAPPAIPSRSDAAPGSRDLSRERSPRAAPLADGAPPCSAAVRSAFLPLRE